MNQSGSKSPEIPEIFSGETYIDSGRLAELKRGVLRESVERKRNVSELLEELKGIGPAVAAVILAMTFAPFMEQGEKKKNEDKKESGGSEESPRAGIILSPEKKPAVDVRPDIPVKKEPLSPKTAVTLHEMPGAGDLAVIGDSIPKGMISGFRKGKKPDFIGEAGRSSFSILNDVRNNPEKLKNKKTVIISCGGNDMVSTDDYEKVADNIDNIIKECERAGIKEIIVLTRFPYQKDYTDKPYIKERSRNLRGVILKRFHEPRVKVVDLYKHFADENGDLKEQYAGKGKDKLHPVKAYKDALGIISSESGVDLDRLIA
jgi:hypothetical protein